MSHVILLRKLISRRLTVTKFFLQFTGDSSGFDVPQELIV